MLGVIDADSIIWRVAAASRGVDDGIVRARFDTVMEDMMVFDLARCDTFEAYLTGSNNFRYTVAVTQPYKGNRVQEKPEAFNMLWDYAVNSWGFVVTDGIEADDAVGILATSGQECVIVHIDKDIDMIPGLHFNFIKKIWYDISPGDAIKKFYTQLLTGDRTDNIPGIVGIGPKKADKLLSDCTTEEELYSKCLETYEGNTTYLNEQAELLWIQQSSRIKWTPPIKTK
jgi:hypothetical protein